MEQTLENIPPDYRTGEVSFVTKQHACVSVVGKVKVFNVVTENDV
jgi:hypothetical protein